MNGRPAVRCDFLICAGGPSYWDSKSSWAMSWADLGTLVTVRRRREELKQGISKIVVCLCLGASLIIRQPSRALHPGESCIFLHDNRFKSADAPQPIMKKMDRENRCKHVQLPFTPLSCSSHTVQVITRSMHFCCSKLPKHFHSLVDAAPWLGACLRTTLQQNRECARPAVALATNVI